MPVKGVSIQHAKPWGYYMEKVLFHLQKATVTYANWLLANDICYDVRDNSVFTGRLIWGEQGVAHF